MATLRTRTPAIQVQPPSISGFKDSLGNTCANICHLCRTPQRHNPQNPATLQKTNERRNERTNELTKTNKNQQTPANKQTNKQTNKNKQRKNQTKKQIGSTCKFTPPKKNSNQKTNQALHVQHLTPSPNHIPASDINDRLQPSTPVAIPERTSHPWRRFERAAERVANLRAEDRCSP